MSKRNEVVLVESDDESTLRPQTKLPRLNGSSVDKPSSIKKPFMDLDSDLDSAIASNGMKNPVSVKGYSESSNLTHIGGSVDNNENLSLSEESPYSSVDSDDSDESGRKSSLEPISVEEYDISVRHSLAAQGEEEDAELYDPTEVPPEVRKETRQYLKTHGMLKFLDKYLPTTASANDILGLILRLGFLPKEFSDYTQEDNLIRLIQILNMAMKKSLTMRVRLDNFNTMDALISKIQSANKIMVITGAGILTSLGIPDFRSSKGFYSQLEYLGLTDPQEVFDLDFFHADPSIFYLIAHMILPPAQKFTPLHAFIKLLQDKGKLLRNYTQNIDNLEGVVGIDPEKLIQCHGSFAYALCITCGYRVPGEEIYPQIRAQEIPYCKKCNSKRLKFQERDVSVHESYGVMKPEITFFGEPLPRRYHEYVRKDRQECDLLICIGTSLKVAPVSEILIEVDDKIPQVLINMDPIKHFNLDISLLGYCDDAAAYLCDRLGWKLPYSVADGVEPANAQDIRVESVDETNGVFKIKKV